MKENDIDLSLSKKVAEEASKQVREMAHELEENKDSYILFLKDVVADNRELRKREGATIKRCFLAIFFLIACMTGLFVYGLNLMAKQNEKFMNFMQTIDFYSEVELTTDNESFNTGGITMSK